MRGSASCVPPRRLCRRADLAGSAALVALTVFAQPTSGQSVSGSAEVNVTRSATASPTQSNRNSDIGQNYTVGWSSPLFDPRLVRVNTELTLHRNALTTRGSQQADQSGRQHDLGFRLGTSLFPTGTVPIVFEASRIRSNSAGDLGPSNPIRGAAFVPTGSLPLDFDTETRLLSVGARLNTNRLPKVDLGYRRGGSAVTGGPYRSEQNDSDLTAGVSKDTPRMRQSLRYQRSAFNSQFPQSFAQRLATLDYDFSALLGGRFRLMAHGGQRATDVRSALEPTLQDGNAPYTPPPSNGPVTMRFASTGISYEPTPRLAVRLFGTFDQQTAVRVSTDSLLTTLSTHYTVVRGLTVEASGTAGDRGQMLDTSLVRVTTRTGTAGATYRAGVRWLEGSIGAQRGAGFNTSVDGLRGSSTSWSREASLSSTLGWFGVGTGYERVSSRDELLSLGNFESERVRASAQAQSGRFSLSLAADKLRIERGDEATHATNLQRTFSGTSSYRFWRQSQASATAGGFSNQYWRPYGPGRDDTFFWGLGLQMAPRPALLLSGWVRGETALASSTSLEQAGIGGLGRLEYRLRTLSLALEYRNNRSRIQYATATPDSYRGRQVRVSIARRFAFPG